MIETLQQMEVTFKGGVAVFFMLMAVIGTYQCVKKIFDKSCEK